jgi:hypothetical protein
MGQFRRSRGSWKEHVINAEMHCVAFVEGDHNATIAKRLQNNYKSITNMM